MADKNSKGETPFVDGVDKNPKDNPSDEVKKTREPVLECEIPWYRSCRYTMALVSAFGCLFFYVLRIDLSMAIVCMVRDPDENMTRLWANESEGEFVTSGLGVTANMSARPDVCSDTGEGAVISHYTGELQWSKEIRGFILGSFFYGYIVTQIPGGWLAARYGGKRVFGYGILITVIATLLVPVAARCHVSLMIILRIIMGLGCGMGFPATHHLFGQWAPPQERSRLVTFSYAGTFMGTIVALFFSGILCDSKIDNGWPLIFYVYGVLSFIWWLFWHFLVFDSPDEHPRIDPRERDYIVKSLGHQKKVDHEKDITPWRDIFKSMPVWSIVVAHACNNWAAYTMLTCTPMYMKEVLRFDIKQNGVLSALPYLLSYLAAVLFGGLADVLVSKHIFTLTTTRKLAQCISSGIPAVFITAMGFIECEMRYVAVILLCLTLSINSLSRVGHLINHIDLSPRHAGLLFGISNTAATIPGMISPAIVALLTPNHTREEWLNVFYICSALYLFSTVFYAIFAQATLQPWARGPPINMDIQLQRKVSVISSL